ncbi:MAG: UDP-N-acetylmuramate dehydrogenase [Clostridia bacterium]|nr:UDP-N-acetylmuramate dehydrogenase [Clostridia bacterium]
MKDVIFEYDVDGASLSTMKAGGRVKRLCRPADIDSFVRVISQMEGPYTVLGNGSNVVFSSAGYDGTVVLTTALTGFKNTEKGFICGAGVSLSVAALRAAERGLRGMEFAYGIPGTVGGAVYMNAGAYGGEMKDVLVRVTCADREGNIYTLQKDELGLSYRHSVFMEKPLYILSAELEMETGDIELIKAKMTENMSRRRDKQPLEYPSCGSAFKRPEGHFAGALIEQCGLKGFAIGGAQVSEKHAGFVINRGGATGDDVADLLKHVQQTVLRGTGVLLEPEVKII